MCMRFNMSSLVTDNRESYVSRWKVADKFTLRCKTLQAKKNSYVEEYEYVFILLFISTVLYSKHVIRC